MEVITFDVVPLPASVYIGKGEGDEHLIKGRKTDRLPWLVGLCPSSFLTCKFWDKLRSDNQNFSLTFLGVEGSLIETISGSGPSSDFACSALRFLKAEAGAGSTVRSQALPGDLICCRSDFIVGVTCFCEKFCLENIASIPSFRLETGSMKVEDSVPTLPTSLGT